MNIHIMKVNEGKPIKTLMHVLILQINGVFAEFIICRGHDNEINQIKCNPSRTRLASCADDQTARIWNVADLSGGRSPDSIPGLSESDRVIILDGHEHSVSSIAWCPRMTDGVDIIATSVSRPPILLPFAKLITLQSII